MGYFDNNDCIRDVWTKVDYFDGCMMVRRIQRLPLGTVLIVSAAVFTGHFDVTGW